MDGQDRGGPHQDGFGYHKSERAAKFRGVPKSARQVDLINIQYWRMRLQYSTKPEVFIKNAFVNVSQGVERGSFNQRAVPCFGVNSLIYSYEKDCTISGSGHLRAIGWPKSLCAEMSDHECRSLAGESFSLPIASAIVCALWLEPYAEWWRESACNAGATGAASG